MTNRPRGELETLVRTIGNLEHVTDLTRANSRHLVQDS